MCIAHEIFIIGRLNTNDVSINWQRHIYINNDAYQNTRLQI